MRASPSPANSTARKLFQVAGRRGLTAATPWTYRLRSYGTPDDPALGLAGLRFTDGPRGINLGRSTAFPAAIARGASWDPELERRVGRALGLEARARGANAVGSVCVNLVRHPGWGRAQESYGADPLLLGRLGAAHVEGLQENVIAVVKHFALNSIENTRFKVDVRLDEGTMREHYLPQFKACVDAGAGAVMTAYNRVNGAWCSESRELHQVLREEWGFDGIAMSDFFLGVRSVRAMARGLDLEMPQGIHFSRLGFEVGRRLGLVSAADLDRAATRVIETKRRFGLTLPGAEPPRPDTLAHRRLALESARRGLVLLANRDRCLPLDASALRRVAVVGPRAADHNLGSPGSCSVKPPHVITALDGLRASLGADRVRYEPSPDPDLVAEACAAADAAIVVAGLRPRDEGEAFPLLGGGDREVLELDEQQVRVIAAASEVNARTMVVLIGGSAIACGAWADRPGALLMAWYPGMEGGRAIAELLLGGCEPQGRLPVTFPAATGDLPPFDCRSGWVRYDDRYDYRHFQATKARASFPFGHGLSYTTCEYRSLACRWLDDGSLAISLTIANVGERIAEEVPQAYLTSPAEGRPLRRLAAFDRVSIPPGTGLDVDLVAPAWVGERWSSAERQWTRPKGRYLVEAGRSSGDLPLTAEVVRP